MVSYNKVYDLDNFDKSKCQKSNKFTGHTY